MKEIRSKHALKVLPTREQMLAAHRRTHRPGWPGKIEGDPELAAFIRARIDTLTFAQIVSEVRATFPPDRIAAFPTLAAGGRNGTPDRVPKGQPGAVSTDGLQSQARGKYQPIPYQTL